MTRSAIQRLCPKVGHTFFRDGVQQRTSVVDEYRSTGNSGIRIDISHIAGPSSQFGASGHLRGSPFKRHLPVNPGLRGRKTLLSSANGAKAAHTPVDPILV